MAKGTAGKPKYWIEINYVVTERGKKIFSWCIKAINGRRKCISSMYFKRAYCVNDAKVIANMANLEIRNKCKNT
jgi:hypothetical protein